MVFVSAFADAAAQAWLYGNDEDADDGCYKTSTGEDADDGCYKTSTDKRNIVQIAQTDRLMIGRLEDLLHTNAAAVGASTLDPIPASICNNCSNTRGHEGKNVNLTTGTVLFRNESKCHVINDIDSPSRSNQIIWNRFTTPVINSIEYVREYVLSIFTPLRNRRTHRETCTDGKAGGNHV